VAKENKAALAAAKANEAQKRENEKA